MMKETKIKFNPNLEYQKEAISSSLLLFSGQQKSLSPFTISQGAGFFAQDKESLILGEGNRLTISKEGKMLDNLRSIQMENGLDVSENMKQADFTIEMETGTGKTYVYLRTIINLYLQYDFKKFIIVVPNRAIREGVNASLRDLQEHFHALYGIKYRHFIYNSQDLGQVTSFARSNTLEVMIINISAFNRSFKDTEKEDKANVIHRPNEKTFGRKPIDLLAETNPIVIIDEPQSVDNTDKAKESIAALNPMAIFRYSATHRQITNPIYKLGPVEAYNQELVKQIEVLSIFEDSDLNGLYIKVISTSPSKKEAELEMNFMNGSGHVKRDQKKIKYQSLLHEVTGNPAYIGCRLTNIDDNGIELNGHEKLYTGGIKTSNSLYSDDELKRTMIRETIKVHFEKQLSLLDKGIKVLSLFFIDRVVNFRDYEAEDQRGKYAQMFDDEFLKLTQENVFYQELFNRWGGSVSKLREGYFSEDKRGISKDTKGDTDGDISTYEKIMKRKGILLSETEPIRFIFSHSALREGWDNPNVFQICILKDPQIKEDKSIRLRQEIGRGLRISVNQDGERVHDKGVNILTVTANEAFGDFVSRFQTELKDDIGEEFNRINPQKFKNITYMDDDGVRHVLGESLANELYRHLEAEGLVEKNQPTQKLKDTLHSNPLLIVPQGEIFKPYAEAIAKRAEELSAIIEIKKRTSPKKVRVNKQIAYLEEFTALWDRVKYKTTYSVDYNVNNFKLKCIKELNELQVRKIVYNIERGTIQIDSDRGVTDKDGVKTDFNSMSYSGKVHIPDIIRYLQNETGLKRQTLIEILSETRTLGQIIYNPQLYMELVRDTIKRLMQHELVEGIKYEKLGGEYDLELPVDGEIEQYFNKLMAETPNRCVFDHIGVDSKEEQHFAQQLDNNERVSCFMKLPSLFKIDTPLGTYNPDWAVYVKGIENKVYFIVETKGTNIFSELKPSEQGKINCAKKHFEVAAPEVIVAAPVKGNDANRWLSGL